MAWEVGASCYTLCVIQPLGCFENLEDLFPHSAGLLSPHGYGWVVLRAVSSGRGSSLPPHALLMSLEIIMLVLFILWEKNILLRLCL